MSAESSLKKVTSVIESSWKILTIIGAIVLMVYEISVVWIKLDSTEKEFHQFKEEYKKEMTLLNDKIDKELKARDEEATKKFIRLIEMIKELREQGFTLKNEVEDAKIDQAYEKGKNEMYRQMHKD